MIIRFLPYWLGMMLGHMIYVFFKAFANNAEQGIQWSYELPAAVCIGFISTCIYTVAMAAIFTVVAAVNQTKRLGYVRVRIW